MEGQKSGPKNTVGDAATTDASHESALLAKVAERGKRFAVVGAPGVGKTRVAAALADTIVARGHACKGVCADPGAPSFGPPTAVSLAERQNQSWHLLGSEGLGSLDAGRYRLPLVDSVSRLLSAPRAESLVLEAPGLVRGVAAAELLPALLRTLRANVAIVLSPKEHDERILSLLAGCGVELHVITAPAVAPSQLETGRMARRTKAWLDYMGDATTVELSSIPVVGNPPRADDESVWLGRVVVVLDSNGRTLSIGEVKSRNGETFSLRAPPFSVARAKTLCVRDARFDAERQRLSTDAVEQREATATNPPKRVFTLRSVADVPVPLEPPSLPHTASLDPSLVNGLFGDPLVHLRVAHEKRSILLDLGDARALPTRIAHQATDVCVSHAHLDHFSGFGWLLRMRVGRGEACRIYGPTGMTERVAAQVGAFTWNLVGDLGPKFLVAELRDTELAWFEVQAGNSHVREINRVACPDGILRDEPQLRIRAAVLDHNIPVLAYAVEEARHLAVRRERLEALCVPAGPWLAALKHRVAADEIEGALELPNGRQMDIAALAKDLLIIEPGQKIAYATDFADTPKNRKALIDLAAGADLFLCEAAFLEEHSARAREAAHLTARACGEIALAADVRTLVPIHLSARYADRPEDIYREVLSAFPRTLVPPSVRSRIG